jgi:hypothetical protein
MWTKSPHAKRVPPKTWQEILNKAQNLAFVPNVKKRFHWVDQCRSKFDKRRNHLPSQQGNGMRGQSLALHPVGT